MISVFLEIPSIPQYLSLSGTQRKSDFAEIVGAIHRALRFMIDRFFCFLRPFNKIDRSAK